MKMRVIDRILLGAYAFVSALALIALLICVVSPGAALNLAYMGFSARIVLCILLAALIAGAIYLIMMAFRPEGSAPSSSASVQESSEGSVRVSVRAMETLARRAIEQTEGVLDSKLRIINHEDSVRVEIDIAIGIETHVPVVTAMLQRNVKGIVEEFSGIAVREVVVLVTEIRNNAPAALPAPKDEQMKQVVVVPEQVVHEAEAPAAEEAVTEEPAEEAAAEEPAAEEAAEEAIAAEVSDQEEPAAEEPAEEPVTEESIAEEPAAQESVTEEAEPEESVAEEPAQEEPAEEAGECGEEPVSEEEKTEEAQL